MTHVDQIQKSFCSPGPTASKLFPLLVVRSVRTVTESRLMSLSDGGGEPSTQPFHPFLAAARLLRGLGTTGADVVSGGVEDMTLWLRLRPRSSKSSSSPGVRGRLEEVRDVTDDVDGPGVSGGEDGIGGGVTETERWPATMLIAGRACQKDDGVLLARGVGERRDAAGGSAVDVLALAVGSGGRALSAGLGAGLGRFLACSRSFLSLLRALLSSSSSTFSTSGYLGTPFSTEVSTSRSRGVR